MINEIKEITQLGGQVVIVLLFLYYLNKKDIINKKTYEEFNVMINNHLHVSNEVINKNSHALQQIAVNLKELSLMFKKNSKRRG